MLSSCGNAGAVRRPQHHGQFCLTTKHITDFRHLIDNFIHGRGNEIGKVHVNHRPHAGQRCTDAAAHNAGFRDGGINNPVGKFFRQAPKLAKNTAIADEVFSQNKHPVILCHLFHKRLCHGLGTG